MSKSKKPVPPCVGRADVFFPPDMDGIEGRDARRSREEIAKAICSICPLSLAIECLDSALVEDFIHPSTDDDRDEIRAGMNYEERRAYVDQGLMVVLEERQLNPV